MLPSDRLPDSASGECPLCGYPMDGYMCCLACPNCGYKEDCSDTFTGGPMEAPKDEQEPSPQGQND